MKLHHLTHFIAVAEHGSLHRAAGAIGVAQSAISRSLSELEGSLGSILLERRQRGTTLTPAGERFLIRARMIQEELRRSSEEAAQHAGATVGRLALAMSPTAQMLILPLVMRRFCRAWPGVHVTILDGLAESFEMPLLQGSVDIYAGICPIRARNPGLTQEHLAQVDRIVVSRTDSQWRAATSLAELTQASWIQIRADQREDALASMFEAQGLAPPRAMQATTSMLTVLLLLQSMDAVALVPRSWADCPPAAGAFVQLPIAAPLGAYTFCTLRSAALPLTPAAQAMLDLILDTAPG